MSSKLKIFLLVLMDAFFINIAYVTALLMRFDFNPANLQFQSFLAIFVASALLLTLLKLIVYAVFGLYNSLWRYASTDELIKIILSCIVGNAIAVTFLVLTQHTLPRSVYFITGMLDVLFSGGVRFGYRWLRNVRYPGKFTIGQSKSLREAVTDAASPRAEKRIMLVGAGDAGAAMIKEIQLHRDQMQRVVVAVDDNREKIGKRIAGVKIAGGRSDIPRLARKYKTEEIIIAIPTASNRTIKEIVEICHKTRCKIKILPSLIDLINEKVSITSLRDVDIEDLLGRDPVKVNLKEISGYLEGRIVLVTGAGGSIGSELCRQVARFRPRRLVLFDIYENTVFDLNNELKSRYPRLEIDTVIGSVRERERVEEVFRRYKPHVIFHAAAHKHVPLMEDCPAEAVSNNVLGTENVMDMAEKYVADKFILISTDKAVNPSSVMGATKRICEMLMQEKSKTCENTDFAAVRFGNVLGSNGSVIPTFRKQIAAGGPVTVTHPDIMRYFMTIPEAVQLVIQAGALARGGEIFILDMGEPVRIMDLAENLIRLSGLTPYEDIDIEITGLRPGEKLYEELLLAEEGIQKTTHDKIFIGHPVPASDGLMALMKSEQGLEGGIDALSGMTDQQVKAWIKEMVPNYTGA